MNPTILDLDARVLFFPVRHHSPACARAVRDFIRRFAPATVLIEGPSDFNGRLEELFLEHELPIAIYSWTSRKEADGRETRRGAFYPFCVYSPEWQALRTAREVGASARFIDLPWSDVADAQTPAHRYGEPELRGSSYVAALCEKLGTPDLDALWDKLFEVESLPSQVIWERCHRFCYGVRVAGEGATPREDLARETFMAAQVERAAQETSGRVLVVTGGFHSYALWARLHGLPFDHDEELPVETAPSAENTQSGLALTPYSYERLDALTGYDAGMPSPGFYDGVWRVRESTEARSIGRELLAQTVKSLRKRKQIASSADLIAALSTARALASLRGHCEVWRRDLVDGIMGALVKDELESGGTHPFLEAVQEALRGKARGQIAVDAPVAPLVADVNVLLRDFDLEVVAGERSVELDLRNARDLERSRILHRLRILGVAGFTQTGGSDFAARDDLSRPTEMWQLRWTPETIAGAVEASIYGSNLRDAAISKLSEHALSIERDAEACALLLLDAALIEQGLPHKTLARLIENLRGEGDFFRLSRALDHLLYLFNFDEVLGTAGVPDLGLTLREAWERGVWLLETLGSPQGRDKDILHGVGAILRVSERSGDALQLEREELASVLERIGASSAHGALLRGAATGALWTMGAVDAQHTLQKLPAFAAPAQLGDFLTGLFALAREAAQRRPELVKEIDRLLAAFDDERFLEALPALRLAFSFFTPREKHYLALTLMEGDAKPLPDLVVGVEVAARALALENQVVGALQKYGLRPFTPQLPVETTP